MAHSNPLNPALLQSLDTNSIATAAKKARQLLLCCLDTKNVDSERFARSQLNRFDLWISNIGVCATLHASLDYRLRTAVAARVAVEGNLEILSEQLLFGMASADDSNRECALTSDSFDWARGARNSRSPKICRGKATGCIQLWIKYTQARLP